jgi:hypothetical protein
VNETNPKEVIKMKMSAVRAIARSRGIDVGKMDKAEIIRVIQRDEGNPDYFSTSSVGEWNGSNFLWRKDCMKAV